MSDEKKLIDQIPTEVRDYLTAGDGLAKAAVIEKYPDVERVLHSASTRAEVVQYLGSREPWQDSPGLTINALAYLQTDASAKEAAILQPLFQHPNAWVRLRMYEYMMGIYYPIRDQASMAGLFQRMLSDPDEVVRVQAARWIKGLNLAGEMRSVLEHWIRVATQRKWDHQESFEIVQGLLRRQ